MPLQADTSTLGSDGLSSRAQTQRDPWDSSQGQDKDNLTVGKGFAGQALRWLRPLHILVMTLPLSPQKSAGIKTEATATSYLWTLGLNSRWRLETFSLFSLFALATRAATGNPRALRGKGLVSCVPDTGLMVPTGCGVLSLCPLQDWSCPSQPPKALSKNSF